MKRFRITPLFLVCLFVESCTLGDSLRQPHTPLPAPEPLTLRIDHAFYPRVEKTFSDRVYSVEWFRNGKPGALPVLRLKSNDVLELKFDLLEFESRDLRVRFEHYEPDWTLSNQPETFFMEGYPVQLIRVGQVSRALRPSYRSYSFRFPNPDLKFRISGNYLLTVEDGDTGLILFTKVFFVTENVGEVISSVEKRMSRDDRLRRRDYPVSRYLLPEDLENPQFNLKFFYVQNGFWGQAAEAEELDFSMEEEVQFEMRQEQPFVGDMEFLRLPLSDVTIQSAVFAEVEPADEPPKIALFDDVQGFSASLSQNSPSRMSKVRHHPDSRYAEVFFRFDPEAELPPDTNIFLTGGFSNWQIQERYRMEYDAGRDRWVGSAVMKEGEYAYKYVLVENGRMNDTALDDLFSRTQQEYRALVYFRDPDRFYHRLLQVHSFR